MKEPENKCLDFFLGVYTPQGFVSQLDGAASAQEGWRLYLIRGGGYSGNAAFMTAAKENLSSRHRICELIHNSVNAEKIDAVILPEKKIVIVSDGAEYKICPKYPGAFEIIIDLSDCLSVEKLAAERNKIITLADSSNLCLEHACRFLSSACSLSGDIYRIALDSVQTDKLSAYCARIAEKEFKPVKASKGEEKIRFLTAHTSAGGVHYINSVKTLCERIYVVNDDFGAVSRLLLSAARSKALGAGYDVISCYCPTGPFEKLEQLMIPELKLGFITSNRYHDFKLLVEPYRIINSQRFSDEIKLKKEKRRILFERKTAAQMAQRAESLLSEANILSSELEKIYSEGTDFRAIENIAKVFLENI